MYTMYIMFSAHFQLLPRIDNKKVMPAINMTGFFMQPWYSTVYTMFSACFPSLP